MSVVEGVSFAQIGTRTTSFTTCVTIEICSVSLPMFEPMSFRSMCGHDRFSSSASAPSSWHAFASNCQLRSSSSLPDPAMIEATRMRSGNADLIRASFGIHQSSGLSEISSQFHDECSAVPGRFFIDSVGESGIARRNFVFGPSTFTTGCKPIVFVTTPPHPASKARMMLLSDSVGGAEASRNGFSNRRPVKVTASCGPMGTSKESGNYTPIMCASPGAVQAYERHDSSLELHQRTLDTGFGARTHRCDEPRARGGDRPHPSLAGEGCRCGGSR